MQIKAVVYTPWASFERIYLIAAQSAGMELHASPNLQDFGSQLFRDPDAIGILWSMGSTSAAMTMHRLRQGDVKNRIIVLIHWSEGGTEDIRAKDRAEVLLAGADDAQSSLIETAELAARLKAICGRGRYVDHRNIEMADCTYVHDNGEIIGPGGTVRISCTLGKLLVALARHPGEIRSKAQLMDALYGGVDEPDLKIIDVLVCKLRIKIVQATGGFCFIDTAWGRGYRWVPDGFRPDMVALRARPRGKRTAPEETVQ